MMPTSATPLQVGAIAQSEVDAREMWNATGVLVENGGAYEVTVLEITEEWKDASVKSDPQEGWTGAVAKTIGLLARAFARDPCSPMYALVAARGRAEKAFTFVGRKGVVTGSSAQAVELLLFANDWPGRYANNFGRLKVQVKRVG